MYIQFSSVAQSCPILCDPMNRSTPGLRVHHHIPVFTQITSIESVMPSSHLILGCPLLLLPPISPSIRVFSNESSLLMRWPKYWSFSFSIIPSKEIPGLIFRIDWLDLLAVQGTLNSFLQHHSSKNSLALSFLYSPTLTSIKSVMPSSHLILCRPLLLLSPVPPSIRVFSNESTLCIGGQSIGASASASVLPMNMQG